MLLLVLIFPIGLLIIFLGKCIPETTREFIRQKPLHQFMLIVVIAYAVHAAQKPPEPEVRDVTFVLSFIEKAKLFLDPSNRFIPWLKSLAYGESSRQSMRIFEAVDDVVADGTNTLHSLKQDVATNDISRLYLAFSVPRNDENISIRTIKQQVSFDASERKLLNLYIHFSTPPATNVNVHAEYSIAEHHWIRLTAITNSFPETESISGYECYKYTYEYPATDKQLIPPDEIALGGYAGQYFDVTDIIVAADGNYYLAYTGWDDYSADGTELKIRFAKGIAVEAIYNGVRHAGNTNVKLLLTTTEETENETL